MTIESTLAEIAYELRKLNRAVEFLAATQGILFPPTIDVEDFEPGVFINDVMQVLRHGPLEIREALQREALQDEQES